MVAVVAVAVVAAVAAGVVAAVAAVLLPRHRRQGRLMRQLMRPYLQLEVVWRGHFGLLLLKHLLLQQQVVRAQQQQAQDCLDFLLLLLLEEVALYQHSQKSRQRMQLMRQHRQVKWQRNSHSVGLLLPLRQRVVVEARLRHTRILTRKVLMV